MIRLTSVQQNPSSQDQVHQLFVQTGSKIRQSQSQRQSLTLMRTVLVCRRWKPIDWATVTVSVSFRHFNYHRFSLDKGLFINFSGGGVAEYSGGHRVLMNAYRGGSFTFQTIDRPMSFFGSPNPKISRFNTRRGYFFHYCCKLVFKF